MSTMSKLIADLLKKKGVKVKIDKSDKSELDEVPDTPKEREQKHEENHPPLEKRFLKEINYFKKTNINYLKEPSYLFFISFIYICLYIILLYS